MMPTSPDNFLAQVIFGVIGSGVFMYGKAKPSLKILLIGVALMGYTFVVEETWMIYAVGIGLLAALTKVKD